MRIKENGAGSARKTEPLVIRNHGRGEEPITMDHPHQLATTILDLFYDAHKLIGVGAVLTNGIAGTIKSVRLDDDHGLRISIGGHLGYWPVSMLKNWSAASR
jgi:hypothetical protein